MFRALILTLLTAMPAMADGERAGKFDYYVMALSWTPNWCALEGDRKRSDQCDDDTGFGFTLHGVWPQFNVGWPSYCTGAKRAPSRRQTNAMTDIMGSGGLAWHQWKKHGTCSGLTSEAYFQLSRDAYNNVKRPEVFRKMEKTYRIPSKLVKNAFLETNPKLQLENIQVTCKNDAIQEVRICLNKELEYTRCTFPIRSSCGIKPNSMAPMR
jgi:ribonuclease T2